jgi:hypothetical protein
VFVLLHALCCRLQAYASEYDDDVKDLQRRDLTPKQRLAAQVIQQQGNIVRAACRHPDCTVQRTSWTPVKRAVLPLAAFMQLRLGEKRILSGTMGGVRRRLAPIRGIPTKVR